MRQLEGVCSAVLVYRNKPVLLSECRCHRFRLTHYYVFLFEEIPDGPLVSRSHTFYTAMLNESQLPAGFWEFEQSVRQQVLQEILNANQVQTHERNV